MASSNPGPGWTVENGFFVVETRDGSVEYPLCLIEAVAHNAERVALLTAAALDATGLFSSPREASLPANFLLELGAVLQIGAWERQGLRHHIEFGLPEYSQAAHELAVRAEKGHAEFQGPQAALLSARVLRFWIEHLAWHGQELMQADIFVSDVDEDVFVDALAEFLWTHRSELSPVLSDQGVAQ